jgi:glyoxylase-like metal-dependent hydrolase (beta-lactamase superfamily II)
MKDAVRTIQVGRARVHIINMGMLHADLAEWLRVPQQERTPATKQYFAQPMVVPVLSVLIELPETAILVDACDPLTLGNSSEVESDDHALADLSVRLAAQGIPPERIEHVVITHLHFDHYSGVTRERHGRPVPCFPQARHYIGRADWAGIAERLVEQDSLESKTLAVLQRHGLLTLVERDIEIADEVRILAAPGESPGHQIVRLHSNGQTLYCLGDLYHHTVEVEQPEWVVHWADPETTRRSRAQLIAAALAEDALLTATHIPTLGRLRATPDGVRWDAL